MKNYYLNSQSQANGDHEVHTEECSFLPAIENRIFLGDFNSCGDAVSEAKRRYQKSKVDGCYYCSNNCHKS